MPKRMLSWPACALPCRRSRNRWWRMGHDSGARWGACRLLCVSWLCRAWMRACGALVCLACDGPAVILLPSAARLFSGPDAKLPIPDMARAARRAGCGRKPSGSCRLETSAPAPAASPSRRRGRPAGTTPARPARRRAMAENRGVVYMGQGRVEVQPLRFPELADPRGRRIGHGAILKVVATNICGSDQHMVRAAPRRPRAWCWGTRLPARSSRSAPTWRRCGSVIWCPCRSTWPAAVAAAARNRTRACA